MKRITMLLATIMLPFFISGCSSDDDEVAMPAPQVTYANVRIIHASSDAPEVTITADGEVLNGLEGVDYQAASGRFEVASGTYDVGVTAILPGDDAEVLQADLTLDADKNYDVFALGDVSDQSLTLLPVISDETAVQAGNAQVQIVHAASHAPTVDIYVTAPDADISTEQPLVTAAFKDATDLMQVMAGDYQIRITPAGTTDVVFDSGTVQLPDGADLLIAATNNVGAGTSPVTLLLSDGSDTTLIRDKNTPADIRVVHAISDAPAVDVIANNASTIVDGLAFPDATDYLSVAAADYLIDVVADADNSVVAINDAAVSLHAGMKYTAIANNTLAMPELDLMMDMPRAIATEARVRIIHASPSAGNVDIYVTADGDISAMDPTFANVSYSTDALAETGYVSLAGGDYVVTVTAAGTKDVAIDTGTLTLMDGKVYTAIAADGAMAGASPQLILLDDFNSGM